MLRFLVVLGAVLCLIAAPAAAQLPQLPTGGPTPDASQAHDGKGFRDILPPGTRGRYNAVELAAFLATGQTVPHCCDQLGMYRDLVYATPGLTAAQVPNYFKDSSFGVAPGQAERTYSPRSDVTIVRDKSFGVPHVDGRTRGGARSRLRWARAAGGAGRSGAGPAPAARGWTRTRGGAPRTGGQPSRARPSSRRARWDT